jgi:hypothetical protein
MQRSGALRTAHATAPRFARVSSNIPAISLCPGWIAECRRCDLDCRFLFLGYRKENTAACDTSMHFKFQRSSVKRVSLAEKNKHRRARRRIVASRRDGRRKLPSPGIVKLPVIEQPGIDSRLPSSGSLSPVKPENLALTIHAFCKNLNWREILALRQMKFSPRGGSFSGGGSSASSGDSSEPYSRPRRRMRWKRTEEVRSS